MKATNKGCAVGEQRQGRAVHRLASDLRVLSGRVHVSEITHIVTAMWSAKHRTRAAEEPVRTKMTPSVGGRELISSLFF